MNKERLIERFDHILGEWVGDYYRPAVAKKLADVVMEERPSMTEKERELLLMIAKDMRRLWTDSVFALSKNITGPRVEQYNTAIFQAQSEEGDRSKNNG
jgi:hypothetical protein